MATERKPYTLHIQMDNVLPADAIALMKMFKYMEYLGNIGSSRHCSFFADGDGSFRPKVSFVYPIDLPDVPEIDGVVKYVRETEKIKGHLEGYPVSSEGDFAIDSDAIGWRIYYDSEK